MKAIVYTEYGLPDVLELKEVEKPTHKDDEVLVKVQATAVNQADWYLLTGKPLMLRLEAGFTKPKNQILGADIAGIVEAVGKDVKQFQPGDAVFGDISECGWGGLAEYVSVHEKALALKPANVSFEEAAAVPLAAITALQGIRDTGQIQAGQKVLINGASGGVGSFAVQLAKMFGAEVTAVCSTNKMEMVRTLGADHVIDYTKDNFTQSGQQYDLIIGVNGYHSLADYRRALNPGGTYVCVGGKMTQIFQAMLLGSLMSRDAKKLTGMGSAKPNQKDLTFMQELLEAGKINPVIDKCYPLNETAAAFKNLGEGHTKGKIVIKVADNTISS